MFANDTIQQKSSSPTHSSSYFSRMCSLITWRSSSSSSFSIQNQQQPQQDDSSIKYDPTDIEQDYYFIKPITPPNSVQATLNLIKKLDVVFSEDLLNEFRIIKDKLIITCHQFDKYTLVDQFANTDKKIGAELKLYIQFMIDRYKDKSTWLVLIGLLMIGMQVLKTQGEVKCQLIYKTKIGRDLALAMEDNLFNRKKHSLPSQLKSGILNVVLECHPIVSKDGEVEASREEKGCWFSALKDVCFELAEEDSSWSSRERYYQVVSMATQLLLDQAHSL